MNPLLDNILPCLDEELDDGMLAHIQYWELYEAPEPESAEWVLAILAEQPGLWIAALCRAMHWLPEDVESIKLCGLCSEYANPRKRKRAQFHLEHTLPGIEPAYQLRPPCSKHGLTWLRKLLYKLPIERRREKIPDQAQARGWDWGSRCYLRKES